MASLTVYPTSVVTLSDGDVAFSDPNLASASGGGSANSTASADEVFSDHLFAHFDLSALPSDATIIGIALEASKGYTRSGNPSVVVNDGQVMLTKSGESNPFASASDDKGDTSTTWTLDDFTTVRYPASGNADLWGLSWTRNELQDANGFGAIFQAHFSDPGTTGVAAIANVDFLRLTVYYTSPQTVSPGTVASAEFVHSPTLNQIIGAGTIASNEAVYSPQVNQSVAPSTVASNEAVNAPTVAPGAVTILPSAIASGETVYSLITNPDGWSFLVDWNNDGDYLDANENITGYVKVESGVTCDRGKDAIAPLAPPIAGRSNLVLNNQSQIFSIRNSGSPLYGQIKTGRAFQWRLGLNGNTYYLYTGLTQKISENPAFGVWSVELSTLGNLSKLAGKKVSTALYENITTGDAITYLLDAAGWPVANRVIDNGQTILRYWWVDDEDAFSALVSLLLTEGLEASIFEDGRGYLVFQDRHYRYINSSVSALAFTTSGAAANVRSFEFDEGLDDIINSCSLEVVEREVQDESVIWSFGATLMLAPNESRIIKVKSSSGDPFTNAQTPSPSSGRNEVQELFTVGSPTGGSIGIAYGGQAAPNLAKNAASFGLAGSASTLQSVLENLSSIGAGNVSVTGGVFGTNSLIITFQNALGLMDVDLLQITSQLTGGTNPTASILETTKGRTHDYTLISGSLSALTLDRTSGGNINLTITAGASGAVIEGLQLRAQLVTQTASYKISNTVDASDSIVDYGQKPFSPATRKEIDSVLAQHYCNAMVSLKKSPKTDVVLEILGFSEALLETMVSLEISDRITVTDSHSGIDSDFYIEKIKHDTQAKNLVSTFGCEQCLSESVAIVGSAIVGECVVGF